MIQNALSNNSSLTYVCAKVNYASSNLCAYSFVIFRGMKAVNVDFIIHFSYFWVRLSNMNVSLHVYDIVVIL